jgi:hypothetical protein
MRKPRVFRSVKSRLTPRDESGVLRRGDYWATSFLLATAQMLGRRVMGMNEELVRLSAQSHQNLTQRQVRKAVGEIEQLWKRLTTEWTF